MSKRRRDTAPPRCQACSLPVSVPAVAARTHTGWAVIRLICWFGRRPAWAQRLRTAPSSRSEVTDAAAQQALKDRKTARRRRIRTRCGYMTCSTMNDLVGIIRNAVNIQGATLPSCGRATIRTVEGHRQYNPGWNLVHRLRATCYWSASVWPELRQRTKSRGGSQFRSTTILAIRR